jgi:hypothetical protein
MRYRIVKEDLGTIIIVDINFGDFSFLIGIINAVDENIVIVISTKNKNKKILFLMLCNKRSKLNI